MNLDKMIQNFNNGDDDFMVFFGTKHDESIHRFLSLVKHKSKLDQILWKDNDNLEYGVNNVLHFLFKEPEYREKIIDNAIDYYSRDVTKVGDIIYLNFNDIRDLSDFFCNEEFRRGEMTSGEIANSVLSDDFWEPYDDTVNDLYDDVIEELSPENLDKLGNILLRQIGNTKIESDDDDLISTIADEQGHPEYVILEKDDITRILKDKSATKTLFRNGYVEGDLETDLYNLHGNAYNGAYINELYKMVWNALGDLFGEGEYVKDESLRNINKYRFDITELFPLVIGDFIDAKKGYTDNIQNYWSFNSLVNELFNYSSKYECLKLGRIPDYPDHIDVRNNLNSSFDDYIY
jgi:hypothetical protein